MSQGFKRVEFSAISCLIKEFEIFEARESVRRDSDQ